MPSASETAFSVTASGPFASSRRRASASAALRTSDGTRRRRERFFRARVVIDIIVSYRYLHRCQQNLHSAPEETRVCGGAHARCPRDALAELYASSRRTHAALVGQERPSR